MQDKKVQAMQAAAKSAKRKSKRVVNLEAPGSSSTDAPIAVSVCVCVCVYVYVCL